MPPHPEVEVRRSPRRKRTVSAYRNGRTTIILVPAGFSRDQERLWVGRMLRRLEAREKRRKPSNAALQARADRLTAQYLDGRVFAATVRWVANQNTRWGSCTQADRSIRLSERLLGMPEWVIDYVLVHELAHLVVSGHGPEFWALVNRYPKTERARGYLEGVDEAPRLNATSSRIDAR